MDTQQVIEKLCRCAEIRILVLGDLIVDRYTWGDAERVSPEAPVIVLRVDSREVRLGGAASVAALLRGWNVQVDLATVVALDSAGQTAQRLLSDAGIGKQLLFVDESRITTEKERFIGRAGSRHPQHILRVDCEERRVVSEKLQQDLLSLVTAQLDAYDAILISDYAKGLCTQEVLQTVIRSAQRQRIPVLVDPARRGDFGCYKGATVLKPNRVEAEQVYRNRIAQPADASAAARWISQQCEIPWVVVTLDADGMVLATSDSSEHFSTRPRQVYDITGAGDMALAMLGVAAALRIPQRDGVILANVAAGLEVERWGVDPVALEEILTHLQRDGAAPLPQLIADNAPKQLSLEQAATLAEAYRNTGKTVVLTNGCFDLLHVGHVIHLEAARRLGDVLFVAINSDESVRCLKGPTRPVINQDDRARMLSALESVDHIVVFNEATPHELLRRLRPDVLVKGGTYSVDEVVGKELVEAYGGRVTVTGRMEDRSTTRIVERIAESKR